MKGKDKCEMLKKIRSEFAQKNGIDYSPSECNHDGDCDGVCSKCEEEADMLMKEVKEYGISSIEITPIDRSLVSDDILMIDDNCQLIDIVDIETTNGIIAEDEVLGGDIMIDDNDNEDIVDITEQKISLDYLANDENKDDDLSITVI